MAGKNTNTKAAFQAGVSKVDITPREAIWLAGWGARKEPMQGVSQNIFVKVLALKDASGKVFIWLTSDLLGFSKGMSDEVVARVLKKSRIPRERIILNATHNHSGPVTGDLLHLYFDLTKEQYAVIDRYTDWLIDRMCEAIDLAIADLAPAELAYGLGLAGFAVNRRRARGGGKVLPQVVDQDVPVLTVRDPKSGALRGIMFGYSCHTTCINNGKLNGDYAGYAQQELEAMNPGAIAMFVTGCGGDQNPIPRWRDGLGEMYGRILAIAVDQVIRHELNAPMKPVTGPLTAAFDHAVIPFEVPTLAELKKSLIGKTGMQKKEREWQVKQMTGGKDRRPRVCQFPIHVWNFGGDVTLIGLSSEPVVDFSLRFKKTYGEYKTWVSGYNDEFFSYIPSLRVWQEGGYEGHTGMLECDLPGPFSPAVEEIIAAKVEELVLQTQGGRPYPRPSKHE